MVPGGVVMGLQVINSNPAQVISVWKLLVSGAMSVCEVMWWSLSVSLWTGVRVYQTSHLPASLLCFSGVWGSKCHILALFHCGFPVLFIPHPTSAKYEWLSNEVRRTILLLFSLAWTVCLPLYQKAPGTLWPYQQKRAGSDTVQSNYFYSEGKKTSVASSGFLDLSSKYRLLP